MNMEEFDYNAAMAELEKIAAKVEDPSTALGDIEKYIKRSDELVSQCRTYLRSARTKIESR